MHQPTIKHYIEFRDGHARIEGRNLKAERVARMHVNAGASIEEVMAHYDLSRAEVHAALAYYYGNQQALDQDYQEALQAGDEAGAKTFEERKAEIEARFLNSQDEY